jgi:hypothetical protein
MISDITTFFTISSRNKNDATNKIREKILKVICDPPKEYLESEEFGESWRKVYNAWNDILKEVALEKDYTSTKIKVKGGRNSYYDADVSYYKGDTLITTIKVEFKNGCSKIDNLPQILSLQAKIDLFPETYDTFWYKNYLDRYLACDDSITESKPSFEDYQKHVTKIKYSVTPFFEQLKNKENNHKKEKNTVVNTSITDYITKHGSTINIPLFREKIKATQTDKIYLLWCNGRFHYDKISEPEMNMSFHSIRNGNILELKAGNTIYSMLLRWRNHKGILNPAWQISMKRI